MFENADANLRVATFRCDSDMVVVVRGIPLASHDNLQEEVDAAFSQLPDLVAQLYAYVEALYQNGALDGFRLHLTGHSVGASAVNVIVLQLMQMESSWISKITSAVLFENPGVPCEMIDDLKSKLMDRYGKSELREKYGDVSSKVTEYFGAPNF